MTASTARGAFRYPEPADNSRNVRLDIQRLAEDTAARAALYVEGTAATRPAPGVAGRLHRATDTGTVTWDTGTSWDDVAVSRAGGSTIVASAPAVRPLTVRAASGQTSNLLEAQASDGTVAAAVFPNGSLFTNTGNISAGGQFGRLSATPLGTTQVGLVVRGTAGMTANLAEYQAPNGTVLSGIDSAGRLLVTQTDGGALGAYQGAFSISINGILRRVPFYL